MERPELKITVFSDYICPFCYIGHHRLQQLKSRYDLKINWCFVELHPETPAEGISTNSLQYSDEQWQGIVNSLNSLIEQDQLPFRHEHTFTTNSHRAMLLAEICKPLGAETFYCLHNRIFEAFFVEMQNIGDETVLRQIAAHCNIPAVLVDRAMQNDQEMESHLATFRAYAQQSGIQGVPTMVIGQQVIPGVASLKTLFHAAEEATTQQQDT